MTTPRSRALEKREFTVITSIKMEIIALLLMRMGKEQRKKPEVV